MEKLAYLINLIENKVDDDLLLRWAQGWFDPDSFIRYIVDIKINKNYTQAEKFIKDMKNFFAGTIAISNVFYLETQLKKVRGGVLSWNNLEVLMRTTLLEMAHGRKGTDYYDAFWKWIGSFDDFKDRVLDMVYTWGDDIDIESDIEFFEQNLRLQREKLQENQQQDESFTNLLERIRQELNKENIEYEYGLYEDGGFWVVAIESDATLFAVEGEISVSLESESGSTRFFYKSQVDDAFNYFMSLVNREADIQEKGFDMKVVRKILHGLDKNEIKYTDWVNNSYGKDGSQVPISFTIQVPSKRMSTITLKKDEIEVYNKNPKYYKKTYKTFDITQTNDAIDYFMSLVKCNTLEGFLGTCTQEEEDYIYNYSERDEIEDTE